MKTKKSIRTLSFRFDIDGIGDIEVGVPRLLSLADSFGVKFSFYVNMGTPINLRYSFINWLKKSFKKKKNNKVRRISILNKHDVKGILKMVFYNPYIGVEYKGTLSELQSTGHELGLHGGMDHALWMYGLESLTVKELKNLLLSAYKRFERFYGKPYGFCSPGFNYNKHVLRLADEFGFLYVVDMEGEIPFRPTFEGKRYNHYQIPVNVIGESKSSLFSYLFSKGLNEKKIQERMVEEIMKRETAIIYGHPSVEGKKGIGVLENVIKIIINEGYKIITLKELVSLKLERNL
jgi:peptidoglycan/xylan/chitin deacetylase (PgdA/CDA1 family)